MKAPISPTDRDLPSAGIFRRLAVRGSGWLLTALWGLAATVVAGCAEPPPAAFHINALLIRQQELDLGEPFTERQLEDIEAVMTDQFGTADEPAFPQHPDLDGTLTMDLVQQAAGPPRQLADGTPAGLYRRHCAHCHGISGDGRGPTAAHMNPYPRDFRAGLFSYKSTMPGAGPTQEDLRRVIRDGIPGTAMPGYPWLSDGETKALIEYVKFLTIRGEAERFLIFDSADADYRRGERLDTSRDVTVEDYVAPAAARWQRAEESVVRVPERPDVDARESARRGRELFHGPVANCASCHGETGMGDGDHSNYDEWTKPLEPGRPDRLAQYLQLGALPPRNILPHNLRSGIYRGGRRGEDLYRRIAQGIEGTPMPAISPELSSEDVWALVDYVRSLPLEPINRRGRSDLRLADTASDPPRPFAVVTLRQFAAEVRYPGNDGELFTLDDPVVQNVLEIPRGEEITVLVRCLEVQRRLVFDGVEVLRDEPIDGSPDGDARRLVLLAPAAGEFEITTDRPFGFGHAPWRGKLVVDGAP